jgi:hypothetical protein
MKKLLLLISASMLTGCVLAQDTLKSESIYVEPIPVNVTLVATYNLAGQEVPFETKGLTFWLLSDGTIRKYYRI